MGASASKEIPFELCLLSLTKIDEIRDYFNTINIKNKNDLELTNIFSDIIKDYQLIDKHIPYIYELKKNNNIYEVEKYYEYILDKLNEESKKYNIEQEYKESQITPKQNDYKEENENNNSISLIEKLFFGEKKETKTCLGCKDIKEIDNNKIILIFDLSQLKDFNISNIFQDVNKELKEICNNCTKEIEIKYEIKYIRFPKIIIIILNNNRNGIKIKYNFSEVINNKSYNLICYLNNSCEMNYKQNNCWHNYNIKTQSDKEIQINENKKNHSYQIILIYQEDDKKKDLETFFNEKNYVEAIKQYSELKKNILNIPEKQESNENLILINKKYFNDLSKIINLNFDNLNCELCIQKIIENKKKISEMDKLIIIQDPYDINGDIDFINESILTNLGINEKKEKIRLYRLSKNIFQIIFKDNTKLNLKLKNDKQEISISSEILILNNNKNNIESNKEENKIINTYSTNYQETIGNNSPDKNNNNYNLDNIKEIINDKANIFNSYISSLLISFFNIKELKAYFLKNKGLYKNGNISSLLFDLMMEGENNLKNITNNFINKINELNQDILKQLDFKNLIDFILTTLHNELNEKKNENKIIDCEDYDENLSFYKFKTNYENQNKSIIQNIFFGIIENISHYNCCGLIKYNFDIFKYLYPDITITDKIDLNSLISDSINKKNNIQKFCKMCFLEKRETIEQVKLHDYPEILIVILNNYNNLKMNLNTIIRINQYNYNLFECIIKTKENTYNLLLYDELKKLKKDSSIGAPYVIFLRKGNKIINDNIQNISQENFYNVNKETDITPNQSIIINDNNKQKINNSSNYMNNNNSTNNNNIFNNKDYIYKNNSITPNVKDNQTLMTNNYNYVNNDSLYNNNVNEKNNIINNTINNDNINNKNNSNNYINNNLEANSNNMNNKMMNNNNPNFINNNENKIPKNNEEDSLQITLYFRFKNGKELYLDTLLSYHFDQVIKELKDKYAWLNNIVIKCFSFKEKIIDDKKTLKEIGLNDNSIINVFEA